MGCGCKKKNQSVTTNSTVTIKLSESSSNLPPQEVNIMEQQVNDLVKKIEEINNELDKQ
jgi:hypothetical protein